MTSQAPCDLCLGSDPVGSPFQRFKLPFALCLGCGGFYVKAFKALSHRLKGTPTYITINKRRRD